MSATTLVLIHTSRTSAKMFQLPTCRTNIKVVLAASILSKSGKVLVSRQFVDVSRTRIEGLLAAFTKLVDIGKQHTYVENENVCYVYQPMEDLYLVLITNKQSNILEDLETLRLLSKLVSEYTPLDKEGIISSFDIVFKFDEVFSLGHKESVNVAQVKHYCEMESHEEKLYNLARQNKINETKDVMKRKACEIDKSKIDKKRGDKGGFISVQSMGSGRIENIFDLDTLSSKSTGGDPPAAAAKPSKGGMKLGTTKRTNHILQSLQAEGFAMEC